MSTKKYQLPKEFAQKWIAALRSGEYMQCRSALGDSIGGYCCLGLAGVLCGATDEMYRVNESRSTFLYNDAQHYPSNIEMGVYLRIPEGLKGGPSYNHLVDKLSVMNDAGKSFPEIADWIEQNVEFV